jgi:hypothetical protein
MAPSVTGPTTSHCFRDGAHNHVAINFSCNSGVFDVHAGKQLPQAHKPKVS